MGMAGADLSEAGLSFLGVGMPPPPPSGGDLISKATNTTILAAIPRRLPPGVSITLAVLSINFLGDGLRDAPDVRGRPGEV